MHSEIQMTWNEYLNPINFSGPVAEILDSLDDIEVLHESRRLTPLEILCAIEDEKLRSILEVIIY